MSAIGGPRLTFGRAKNKGWKESPNFGLTEKGKRQKLADGPTRGRGARGGRGRGVDVAIGNVIQRNETPKRGDGKEGEKRGGQESNLVPGV